MVGMQYYSSECMPMPKLAHAYVPFQCLVCLYPPMQGLERGTIFPELDRPYGMDPEYTVDQ
ncbi:MAG: spore coat associated protein CotJA [Clostridia bacterium]|nr:spore coat associated protein CotJA [Clostridia bacterium]